jgi:hypothetical protein
MLTDVLQHFGLRTKPWARQAVELRNKPAHHLPDLLATLTLRQYATYLEEALLGYFLVTAVRYQALYKQRWDAYLRKVIALYENRQATFVDLQVKEQIRLIGVEVKAVGDMSASRKVAVLELRQKVEEKARLLLGNAGMGKTTTLLHLAHRDATQLLAAPTLSTPIPVLVDLAKWTLLEQTIEQYIAQATNEPLHRIQRDFAAARYVLYVDGFNEIQNVQGLEQWLLTNLQTLIQNAQSTISTCFSH